MSESDTEQDVESPKESTGRKMESKKGRKWEKIGEQSTKEAMRFHSDKRACPSGGLQNSS
jgi:hypothetical protein